MINLALVRQLTNAKYTLQLQFFLIRSFLAVSGSIVWMCESFFDYKLARVYAFFVCLFYVSLFLLHLILGINAAT